MVTGRIFGSFAIANILFLILSFFVIHRLVLNLGGTESQALLAVFLVFIPYQVGQTEYTNMLLFGGSQYIIKVLVPLLFILLAEETEKQMGRKTILYLVIYEFLLFITCLSSGSYVLLCGLAPLFLYYFLLYGFRIREVGSKDEFHRILILLAVTVGAALTGLLVFAKSGITTRGSGQLMTKFIDLPMNLHAIFVGLLDVFGTMPYNVDVKVLSFTGFIYILKAAFTMLVLWIGAKIFIRTFLFRRRVRPRTAVLTVVLPWTIFVMIFADTRYASTNEYVEPRYFFIGIVMLLILTGIHLEPKLEAMLKGTGPALACAAVLLALLCDVQMVQSAGSSNYLYDILDAINAQETPVGSVFVIADNDTARILRLLDHSRTYCGAYYDDNDGIAVVDNYESYTSKGNLSQNNLILCITGTNLTDYMTEDMTSTYTYVGTVDWFDMYYSDVCPFGD